jgi:hypothetical protein
MMTKRGDKLVFVITNCAGTGSFDLDKLGEKRGSDDRRRELG